MRQLRGSSWEPKMYLHFTDWACWGAEGGDTRKGKEGSRGCAKRGQGRGGEGEGGSWALGEGKGGIAPGDQWR